MPQVTGYLRLFPGWPLDDTASFTTLRAVGGFLISASVEVGGHVQDVTIVSEVGVDCVVLIFEPIWWCVVASVWTGWSNRSDEYWW